jgi:hypothetical protein
MSEGSAPRSTLARRALPGLLFALLVVAVYSPTLFTRRNFAGRDLLVYHLPIEKAVHDAYARGSLPVWISEISGGRPLAANPNVGAFYPIRPILALLPFPVAMRIFPVLHWIIAGLGVMILLRSLAASRAGAWVGAVTYTFSGVAVTEVFFPNIHPGMALLPWIVWAVQRQAIPVGNRLLVLSLLFGLLFLAGDVFTIGIAIGSALLWIALESRNGSRVAQVGLLALALLVAGLVAAPQIVASILWVPETNRAVLGMKLGESLQFSLPVLRLLELVVPFPFGPTWSLDDSLIWGWPAFRGRTIGFFTSLYAGAFALIALMTGAERRAPGVRFARALFLAALIVSVVPGLLPYRWAGWKSPLPLRFPEKFAVALVFALAILAGLAFDRLRRSTRAPRWPLAVAMGLTLFAAAAALLPRRAGEVGVKVVGRGGPFVPPAEAPSDPVSLAAREVAPALAESGLLWVLTVIALDRMRRSGKRGPWVPLALLTLVPVAANRRIAHTIPETRLVTPTAFERFLHRADPDGRFRTLGEPFYLGLSRTSISEWATNLESGGETWVVYRQALAGRGTVFNLDFDAGDFARVQSLRTLSLVMHAEPTAPAFFASLALRWGIRFEGQGAVPGYRRLGGNAVYHWDELPEALPDVRLVERWREESRPLDAARALSALEIGEIVLESGATERGRARPGFVHVLEKTPERLLVETDAPDPTWLFVLRGFWPYRRVLLDGKPVETLPAQLAFSAVEIPAGRHTVDWTEEVPGLAVSRFGPLLAGAVLALLLIRDRRNRTRLA